MLHTNMQHAASRPVRAVTLGGVIQRRFPKGKCDSYLQSIVEPHYQFILESDRVSSADIVINRPVHKQVD